MPSAKARKEYQRLRDIAHKYAVQYVHGDRHLDNMNLSNHCDYLQSWTLNDNLVRDLMALYKADERDTERGIKLDVKLGVLSEDDELIEIRRHVLNTMKNTVEDIAAQWKVIKRELDTPAEELVKGTPYEHLFTNPSKRSNEAMDLAPEYVRVNGTTYRRV